MIADMYGCRLGSTSSTSQFVGRVFNLFSSRFMIINCVSSCDIYCKMYNSCNLQSNKTYCCTEENFCCAPQVTIVQMWRIVFWCEGFLQDNQRPCTKMDDGRSQNIPNTNMEEVGVYDLYCIPPPGGSQNALASLLGADLSSIFICSLLLVSYDS